MAYLLSRTRLLLVKKGAKQEREKVPRQNKVMRSPKPSCTLPEAHINDNGKRKGAQRTAFTLTSSLAFHNSDPNGKVSRERCRANRRALTIQSHQKGITNKTKSDTK